MCRDIYQNNGQGDLRRRIRDNHLGKHSTGKSCLYIKKLEDVDLEVLKELVRKSVAHMSQSNPD